MKRFSGAIRELYRTVSLDTLSEDFVAALSAVIEADCYSVNWLVSPRYQLQSAQFREKSSETPLPHLRVRNWYRYPEYPREARMEVFNQLIDEHPLFHHWERHGACAAKWSDFTTARDFREKAIYKEYFRHAHVKYQAGTASIGGVDGDVGIACNRNTCDFTENDTIVLELMTPHFEQAMRLACGRATIDQVCSMERAASRIGAVVIISDAGRVLFCNQNAHLLCDKYFGKCEGMPVKVLAWLSGPRDRPLVIARGSETLIVECEVAQRADEAMADLFQYESATGMIYLLKMAERFNAPMELALQALGLTKREAEVLSWMAQGKRNSEIAIIVGAQPATIAKHAEHIFAKLQVETRTAAIARAWETLGT
jgi:DNA-binding CsgD family transcriptional regulator